MKEDKITKRIKELQNDRRFMFKLTDDIIALTYRTAVEDCAKEKKDPDKVYKEEDVVVKSITLKGNNDEKLAGNSTITPIYGQDPTIVMANNARTSITLDCGEGVKIGSTEETATAFWIVVPPTTFEEGLTITVTEIDGESFTKSTSNAVVVERNIIKPMAAFEVEIEKIPNNQIWYTTTDGNALGKSGSNITSDTYTNPSKFATPDTNMTTVKFIHVIKPSLGNNGL